MKKEVYYEDLKELIESIKGNGITDIKIEVLSRKVDRDGLIVPEKVQVEY